MTIIVVSDKKPMKIAMEERSRKIAGKEGQKTLDEV